MSKKIINIAPGAQKRENVVGSINEMQDAGEIAGIVAIVRKSDKSMVIMSSEDNPYDHHAMVGFLQTDAMIRTLCGEAEEGD